MEPLAVAGALAAGTALAAGAVWAAWRATRTPAPEAPVTLEIVDDGHPASVAPAVRAPDRSPALDPRAARAPDRSPARAPDPSPALPPRRGHPERAPAMVLTQGVEMQDAAAPVAQGRAFVRAPARPPMREPPASKSWAQQVMESVPSEVPTEWARRQVGPVEAGRTSGACGGCGARLSVSSARPLRIACPVCGRTKLLAS